MLIPVVLFIVGLILLIKGGDWFVEGATGIAHRFHVPELLIGATVVSIGTTLPEVMVSATSALGGHGEIAYGNALGSIICNTALIAALTIAIRPSETDRKTLKTPVIFFFIAAAIYTVVAYTTGRFSRGVGILLLAVFVIYVIIN
ncbi:MAG: sodium:calcium antiporter, partial [Blautia sp.]|nr:sodium:calcium antiporter [Blautia sp.]